MTPETITARTAAHQRARILRNAAINGTKHCRIPWGAPFDGQVNRMFAAAARQERIGNGERP